MTGQPAGSALPVMLACLVLVIAAVLLVTGGRPPASSSSPSVAVDAIKLALGIVLVVFGVRKRLLRAGHVRLPGP